jgi:hypothetical protein
MGRGQRHSKNAGIMGSEALTYHEKKALGFGTVKERVGKVSVHALPLLVLLPRHATCCMSNHSSSRETAATLTAESQAAAGALTTVWRAWHVVSLAWVCLQQQQQQQLTARPSHRW